MGTAKDPGEAKLRLDENGEQKLVRVLNINKPNTNNMGIPALPDETGGVLSKHFWASETGPVMNTLSKYFPGGNGLSYVHDVTGNYLSSKLGGTINGLFFNFQTMPIAYGLNAAGSTINDAPGLIGIYQHYKDEF